MNSDRRFNYGIYIVRQSGIAEGICAVALSMASFLFDVHTSNLAEG